jgi:hypothetical protein
LSRGDLFLTRHLARPATTALKHDKQYVYERLL